MKTSFMLQSCLLVAIGTLFTTGCVVRERVVYQPAPPPPVTTTYVAPNVVVTEDQPAPYVEVVPVAPGPDFYWVPGEWVWRHHWVWVHGRWAHPPHRGAVWVGGRYEFRGGARVYIGGYWR